MTDMILDINAVPEKIFSKISTKKVRFYEEDGTITLTPISEEKPHFAHLRGMFSDGKISVDDFLEEKDKIVLSEKSQKTWAELFENFKGDPDFSVHRELLQDTPRKVNL